MIRVHFILYVSDQERSSAFYASLLQREPVLHVPGMTEFLLRDGCRLGLMPVAGAKSLLEIDSPDLLPESPFPRAEIYLMVSNPQEYHKRALELGAVEVSPLLERDWKHRAAYSRDPDGYVLAFAEQISDDSSPSL